MFVHDVIKIKYVREGYLPNYPPHLISDEEMCDAFIKYPGSVANSSNCCHCFCCKIDDEELDWYEEFLADPSIMYFKDMYPLIQDLHCDVGDIDPLVNNAYKELVNRIFYEMQEFKNNLDDDKVLPDWIYSYMLGIAVGPKSDKLDIHDMISIMGVDNLEDAYNVTCAKECYKWSRDWLYKLMAYTQEDSLRPPTIFGEPHVLKALRLYQESLDIEDVSTS